MIKARAAEGVGPMDAVKRSSAYLRKTWGEQIVGTAGMGAVFGLISFATVIAGIALAMEAKSPATRVHSVEPAGFDDTARSLRSGRRETMGLPTGGRR